MAWYEALRGWLAGSREASRVLTPRERTPDVLQTEDWAGAYSRAYANADMNRLTAAWNSPTNSADAELVSSLRELRARSRQLIRDNAYAGHAQTIFVNNTVGQGIGIQAQVKDSRGNLQPRINSAIESLWEAWEEPESCHIAGRLHFRDLERLAMMGVFEAGEDLIRFHHQATPSGVPLTLEILEPERLAEEYEAPNVPGVNIVRMGVEHDPYHKALAYWVKTFYPGDLRRHAVMPEKLERVLADYILHTAPIRRWPQTRGEPMMHAVAKRLWDVEGYTHAEIVAMRASANIMGIIQSPELDLGSGAAPPPSQEDSAPGTMKRLMPGETFTEWNPNRPNNGADSFLRFMLREVAAGLCMGYASLTGDYSQANYSSERARMLEDRDQWRVVQFWWLRNFRTRIHREFMRAAVYSGALPAVNRAQYILDPRRFEAVKYKLRGWGWVDPAKEVAAYKEAVKAGFISIADVISQTAHGADFEEMMDGIEDERELIASKGLVFDVLQVDTPAPPAASPAPTPADEGPPEGAGDSGDGEQRVVQLKGSKR